MDDDLASHGDGSTGRHPLPDPKVFAARLEAIGLSTDQQLVAYDAQGGAQAGRLWWLARWIGHSHVAVLDGGLTAWRSAAYPISTDVPANPAPGTLARNAHGAPTCGVDDLLTNLLSHEFQVLDARAAQRFLLARPNRWIQ